MRLVIALALLCALPVWAVPHAMSPWMRVMPANATTAAAYMVLHNTGKQDSALVAASSSAAARVEMHQHVLKGDVAQMVQVAQIPMPAGQQVALVPGGLHLMFIDLNRPLQAGATIPLELQFADGSRQQLQVLVQAEAAADSHQHQHQHH